MANAIFIPETIRVGYRKRDDTYTGTLAYIIYYDTKGVLRKERSWNSWRDGTILPQEFKNEATEGFVLNKEAGGHRSSWNHRATYTRIYDPRGFEFEISIPNLLYILENANCTKGKGLEGKFVYGWDGTDLVLIPESAPEYLHHLEFSNALKNKISTKELVPGALYQTDKNEQLVYLGYFPYYSIAYGAQGCLKGKRHFFCSPNTARYPEKFTSVSGRIINRIGTSIVDNYAALMDELEYCEEYSPYDPSKDEYIPATIDDIFEMSRKHLHNWAPICIYVKTLEGQYDRCNLSSKDYSKEVSLSMGLEGTVYGQPVRNVRYVGTLYEEEYFSYSYFYRISGTPQEIIDQHRPFIKKEYLANGKQK